MSRREEIISGLEALLKESKAAEAKIEFSYEVDRIKKRLTKLEEEIENIKRTNNKTWGRAKSSINLSTIRSRWICMDKIHTTHRAS